MSNAGLPGRQDGRTDGRRSQTSPGGGGAPQRGDQPWTLPTRSLEPRCEQGPAPEETPTPWGSSPSAEHVPPSLGALLAAGAHLALPRPPAHAQPPAHQETVILVPHEDQAQPGHHLQEAATLLDEDPGLAEGQLNSAEREPS